jgi:hypothetical protein
MNARTLVLRLFVVVLIAAALFGVAYLSATLVHYFGGALS